MRGDSSNQGLCVFGEVLFDEFPDGRRVLGGAPFNVAWHLAAFGEAPLLVSRVGEDADGIGVRRSMRGHGMDASGLQTDPKLPTGRVRVVFEDSEPSYDIVHPAAWDAIAAPAGGPRCSFLYHGSLALRDAASRDALQALRAGKPKTVFVDVNLRPPWWNRHQVLASLDGAQWVKLNQHELDALAPGRTAEARIARLIETHGLEGLLVTAGEEGAAMYNAQGEVFRAHTIPALEVVDTVGAGDALSSVTILGMMRGWPLQTTLERAQAFASAIVGRRGATVDDPAFYQPFIVAWGHDAAL
ncbi:MAG: carbohydrate kinase [Gammaproteobacteria bacterium]|nr:carbohydrate kinase [Gammaproteobacteria bacterium]